MKKRAKSKSAQERATKLQELSDLSKRMAVLLEDDVLSDVVLHVPESIVFDADEGGGDGADGGATEGTGSGMLELAALASSVERTPSSWRVVCGHRAVLAAASPYFRAMFTGAFAEGSSRFPRLPASSAGAATNGSHSAAGSGSGGGSADGVDELGRVRVYLPCVGYEAMQTVMQYIYTGRARVSSSNAMELLAVADMMELPKLKSHCERVISSCLNIDEVCFLWEEATRHNATALGEECWHFIIMHADAVLGAGAYPSDASRSADPDSVSGVCLLSRESLLQLLRCDHLNVSDELTVFEAVVRWGRHRVAQDKGARGSDDVEIAETVEVKKLLSPASDIAANESSPTRGRRYTIGDGPSSSETRKLRETVAGLVDEVRFGLIAPQQLHDKVAPLGVVSDAILLAALWNHCGVSGANPLTGSSEPESVFHKLARKRKRISEWDREKHSQHVTLLEGGTVVQKIAGTRYATALGPALFCDRSYWEVRIEASSDAYIMVGVCEDTVDVQSPDIFQRPSAWMYFGCNGQKWHNGTDKTYGDTFQEGDRIGVHLANGVLSFYRNGKGLGEAFSGLPSFRQLRPAVLIYTTMDRVRLLPAHLPLPS